jgi:hypothetical protein
MQHISEVERVIFDFIEWDEHNLDHATRRLTADTVIAQIVRDGQGVRHVTAWEAT